MGLCFAHDLSSHVTRTGGLGTHPCHVCMRLCAVTFSHSRQACRPIHVHGKGAPVMWNLCRGLLGTMSCKDTNGMCMHAQDCSPHGSQAVPAIS